MTDVLPTWSVTDVHESFTARSFVDALEQAGTDVSRLEALFDQHDVRSAAVIGCHGRIHTAPLMVVSLDSPRGAGSILTVLKCLPNARPALPNFVGDGVIDTPPHPKENHMVIKPIAAAAAAVFALTLTACGTDEMTKSSTPSPSAMTSTSAMASSSAMTPSAAMARMGEFTGLNGKHVAGSAIAGTVKPSSGVLESDTVVHGEADEAVAGRDRAHEAGRAVGVCHRAGVAR